jgi:hypothetical protein
MMAQMQMAERRKHTRWERFTRMVRRYREVIMIAFSIALSLAFLAFGYIFALILESQHPGWFGNGY